ncbi:Hypothetical predicted protein, partial [Olea europaea subsp. europaea]
ICPILRQNALTLDIPPAELRRVIVIVELSINVTAVAAQRMTPHFSHHHCDSIVLLLCMLDPRYSGGDVEVVFLSFTNYHMLW